MVTFAKNPYDWVDNAEVNSAVLKFDMTYKDAPVSPSFSHMTHSRHRVKHDASANSSLAISVPTHLPLHPENFTNATLSEKNNYTAVVSLDRGSVSSVLLLYIYVGKMTRKDFDAFADLTKPSLRKPFIFNGYLNITLYRGSIKDALDKASHQKLYEFDPVWLYNFRFTPKTVSFILTCMNGMPFSQVQTIHVVYTSLYWF